MLFLKILFSTALVFASFFLQTFASQIQVENVFSDISKDYKYRDELQKLYDRGMILPDASGKFSPNELLNRDEFVGISMEVICERCIWPHTEYQLIEGFSWKDVYFDIAEKNPYFFCVAQADKQNYVRGYDVWESCQNGTNQLWSRPFCPVNKINLEEAIAVLLRNSGIFTIEDNQKVVSQIQAWWVSQKLWNDVYPTDAEGRPYTFYGYLKKALEFEIVDVDSDGNEKILKLLELDGSGNINPQKYITKEEFLRMSYIALKSNNCSEITNNGLAVRLDIFEKSCSASDTDCNLSDLNDPEDSYDFSAHTETTCEAGVKNPTGYIWRFQHIKSGEQKIIYGRYIDNHTLLLEGEWRVYLRVIDACGNTSEVYNTIFVDKAEERHLDVSLEAQPIFGYESLEVDFKARVNGGKWPFTYHWNFWDGNDGYGEIIDHVYSQDGVYSVTLTVTDSYWNTWTATVVIQVLENNDKCSIDTDKDGIYDCDDACINIVWEKKNKGCPILESPCSWEDCSCPTWYSCSIVDPLTCGTGVCLPIVSEESTCLYSPLGGNIFWSSMCLTCPCDTYLDFLANIRRCDLVFPAITSPSWKDIFSRWWIWQIH